MGRRKVDYQWDAESIHKLREHLDMTQQEMSEELGTRQQTISEWETGMYQPRGGMNRLLTLIAEQAIGQILLLLQEPEDPLGHLERCVEGYRERVRRPKK